VADCRRSCRTPGRTGWRALSSPGTSAIRKRHPSASTPAEAPHCTSRRRIAASKVLSLPIGQPALSRTLSSITVASWTWCIVDPFADLVGYDSKVELQPEHAGLPESVRHVTRIWFPVIEWFPPCSVQWGHLIYLLKLQCQFKCFRWPRSSLSSAVTEPSESRALSTSPASWNASWLLLLSVVHEISSLCFLCAYIYTIGYLDMKFMYLFMCSWWETHWCYWAAATWCIGWHVCVHRTTWCGFQRGSRKPAPLGPYSAGLSSSYQAS
jgi:hypothetical protein